MSDLSGDDPFRGEKTAIALRRNALNSDKEESGHLVGLALSGGGIRSATFCLGLIRALAKNKLLTKVDYLSTVSGGGYSGAMLGRLYQSKGDGKAVENGLANDDTILLAWLRNNGRYLIPAGFRDTSLALTQIFRSFLAALFLITLLCVLVSGIAISVNALLNKEALLLPAGTEAWLWVLMVPFMFTLWMATTYWLTLYKGSARFQLSVAFCLTVLAGTAIWIIVCHGPGRVEHRYPLSVMSIFALLNLVALYWSLRPRGVNISVFRQQLTLAMAMSLGIAALAVLLWFIILAADRAANLSAQLQMLGPPAAVAVVKIIWEFKPVKLLIKKALTKHWLVKVSLMQLANIVGLMSILFAVITVCAAEIYFLRCHISERLDVICYPFFLSLGIVWMFTFFSRSKTMLKFLNLSSLHNFYRARLERAWVSVGNAGGEHPRFGENPLEVKFRGKLDKTEKVTDPVAGDDTFLPDYAPHACEGPVHLMTCCINQTVDDRSGNYNADRKGIALTVSAFGVETGTHPPQPSPGLKETTLSQWVAISGAAAATGMGSRTAPGLAFLLFLIGGRLGYWLPNLYPPDKDRPHTASAPPLFAEMFARFPGRNGKHWFLSDGGHFENTAVYPLLKRRVKTIIVADCGADPDFQFGDLENLIRKARIDYSIDIVFSPIETTDFTSVAELKSSGESPALIKAKILYPQQGANPAMEGTLLIVKPHRLQGMGLDTASYAERHPDFPQQTTGDQFFDEEQWEAYHQLGLQAGKAITAAMLK